MLEARRAKASSLGVASFFEAPLSPQHLDVLRGEVLDEFKRHGDAGFVDKGERDLQEFS